MHARLLISIQYLCMCAMHICICILICSYTCVRVCVCVCTRVRNAMYPPYMHAYVYTSHTQISRHHHSVHQQNAPRACVCVCVCVCRDVLEPLNRTPHVSRTAAAGASSWVAKLLAFPPISFFVILSSHQQLPWQWQSESPCRLKRCRFRAAAAPGAHAGAV